MAEIPPWLNIGPDLFMSAAKAGGQLGHNIAQLQQQDAQQQASQEFQYAQLQQQAMDAEANRQVQYQAQAAAQREAAMRANAQLQEANSRMNLESSHYRDQMQEQALNRGDRLSKTAFDQNLDLRRMTKDDAQFWASSQLRAGELKAREDNLDFTRTQDVKKEIKKQGLFDKVRQLIAEGKSATEIAKVYPEAISLLGPFISSENRPPSQAESDAVFMGAPQVRRNIFSPEPRGTNAAPVRRFNFDPKTGQRTEVK